MFNDRSLSSRNTNYAPAQRGWDKYQGVGVDVCMNVGLRPETPLAKLSSQ